MQDGRSYVLRRQAFTFFELKQGVCGDLAYREHSHDEYSLGWVSAGTSSFWCEGQAYELQPQALVFLPPALLHVCRPHEPLSWQFSMLYVQAPWLNRAGIAAAAVRRLPLLLAPPEASTLARQLAAVLNLLKSSAAALQKETAFLEWLAHLLPQTGRRVWRSSASRKQPLLRVREYLHSCCSEDITLDDLANVAGLTKYHLLRAFKEAYQLPPHAYLTLLRINRAKQELRSLRLVAEVAQNNGFYDQSHFTKTFKRYVGVTPQQYQKAYQ